MYQANECRWLTIYRSLKDQTSQPKFAAYVHVCNVVTVQLCNVVTFRNAAFDVEEHHQVWDFRLLALRIAQSASNHPLVGGANGLDLDVEPRTSS